MELTGNPSDIALKDIFRIRERLFEQTTKLEIVGWLMSSATFRELEAYFAKPAFRKDPHGRLALLKFKRMLLGVPVDFDSEIPFGRVRAIIIGVEDEDNDGT